MINTFPREVGAPRKIVYNKKELLDYVNLYNGKKKSIYYSIYHYEVFDQASGEQEKPDYKSAVLDCLFFDFDDKECQSYLEVKKLHDFCISENIQHRIIMSGRGYHFYVITEPYRAKYTISTIYNAQHYFIDKLNLKVDVHVIGNYAQLARIPNTYNGKANKFCIPLTKEQFERGDLFIRNLALKQNFTEELICENKFKLEKYDYETKQNNFDLDKIEVDLNLENYDIKFPPCILNIIEKGNMGWKERYLLILFLKESGYSLNNALEILKAVCPSNKFNHCVYEERQLQYLYSRDDLIFPTCDKIFLDGFCKGKCKIYNKVIYK